MNRTERRKIKIVYTVTCAGLLIWMGAIFLAPYLRSQSSSWSGFFYSVFSPVCHQVPDRCFQLFGFPLAVCSRCIGIYTGSILGMLLYPFFKGFSSATPPKTGMFILLTSPIALDTVGNFFSLWTTASWLRFSIGFVWGTVLPFYLVSGLSDAWIRLKEKKLDK